MKTETRKLYSIQSLLNISAKYHQNRYLIISSYAVSQFGRFLDTVCNVCVCVCVCVDYQKLEREARICRMLKHPTIGQFHCCLLALSLLL